jgi:hypothetical protein
MQDTAAQESVSGPMRTFRDGGLMSAFGEIADTASRSRHVRL